MEVVQITSAGASPPQPASSQDIRCASSGTLRSSTHSALPCQPRFGITHPGGNTLFSCTKWPCLNCNNSIYLQAASGRQCHCTCFLVMRALVEPCAGQPRQKQRPPHQTAAPPGRRSCCQRTLLTRNRASLRGLCTAGSSASRKSSTSHRCRLQLSRLPSCVHMPKGFPSEATASKHHSNLCPLLAPQQSCTLPGLSVSHSQPAAASGERSCSRLPIQCAGSHRLKPSSLSEAISFKLGQFTFDVLCWQPAAGYTLRDSVCQVCMLEASEAALPVISE